MYDLVVLAVECHLLPRVERPRPLELRRAFRDGAVWVVDELHVNRAILHVSSRGNSQLVYPEVVAVTSVGSASMMIPNLSNPSSMKAITSPRA